MALIYKIKKYVNPSNQYNGWYYARAVFDGVVDLKTIAQHMSNGNTVTEADTLAVLVSMVKVMQEMMQSGKKVHIDGLGYFSLGLKSGLSKTATDFNTQLIRGIHVNFQPEKYMTSNRSFSNKFVDGVSIKQASEYDKGVNDNERQG